MNGSLLFEGNPILSGSLNVNTHGNIEPLEIEINENGTREITPPSGVDGYAPIKIETIVPQIEPVLETLNVTQNGRYEPPSGVAGFNEVNVNVPTPTPTLETLNITQNGTYTPPSGVDGYDEVVVNVPSERGVITPILYKEALDTSMIASHTLESTNIIWNGGTAIGCSLNGNVNLANNNLTRLDFSITTGTCYDSVNGQNIRPLIVGVTSQIRTSPTYVSPTDAPNYFIRYKLYNVNDINKTLIDSIDLTGITGDYYLFIVATGWNFTINKLQLT